MTSEIKNGHRKNRTLQEAVADNRSKSTKVFSFTLKDIADAAGRSLSSVKRAMYSKKLDPRDLKSIAVYIAHGLLIVQRRRIASPEKQKDIPEPKNLGGE
jgi:ParB-like chromosome segregation protein Spo0J